MHLTEIPLAAYIHWPWCLAKCPYCDFNSHRAPAAADRAAARRAYVDALLEDIAEQARRADGRTIETVFLGGGTPSLFTPDEVGAVLDALSRDFAVAGDAEITMEVNPGALERGSFAGYRAAGINRVSIGAQTFDAATLTRLGRLHGPDDTRAAVKSASAAGITRINLDLMHGLPGQTVALAKADVAAALALGVDHISYYQLTLEPNTRFHAFPPALPEESVLEEINAHGAAMLADAGFGAYEVSAWARAGEACRHNLNYWLFGDYLAFGAGAHGKLTTVDGIFRYAQAAHPRSYMSQARSGAARAAVSGAELAFEFMLNALRVTGGFSTALFEQRTGLPFRTVQAQVESAAEDGLMVEFSQDQWAATALGRRFLNDLQGRFLP